MEPHWVGVPGAILLAVASAAVTAVRSALIILGEDGLAEEAARGDDTAARLLAAVREPSNRHPFGLWAAAAILKGGSAVLAGYAACAFAYPVAAWRGTTAFVLWVAAYFLLLFFLEHLSAQEAVRNPLGIVRRGGPFCLRALSLSAVPGRMLDRVGRALFGPAYSPEGLMDVRYGSEEGILDVVEEGAEHGVIDPTEERMIEGVLRFGEAAVAEGMTVRSEVVFLREGMSRDAVDATIGESGFSRYPVLSADGEEVIGVLAVHSLFRPGDGTLWERLLEKPFYVPDSMKVSDLFRQFQRAGMHLAVVIDEHGKLCGVITIHDLLEKIVGRMSGGGEPEEAPEWEKDGALSVPASTPVRVLREEYGIDIPTGSAYETVGGYALDCLQDVPDGIVTFVAAGYRITVAETERFRIRRLRFEKIPPASGTS